MPSTPRPRLKTLSIGGATYDLFLTMNTHVEKSACNDKKITLDLGKKIQIDDVIESCGGGASNTSVGLARLGADAAFAGIIGDDEWGVKLKANMEKEGVSVSSAAMLEGETSSFSLILLVSTGERTILYNPGLNEHLHDVTFDRDALEKADVIFLNHLCEHACQIEDDIILSLSKLKHVHLSWNPGAPQINAGMHAKDKAALLQRTDLLILNKEEALKFTQTDDIRPAMKAFIKAGVKNICMTDGGRGTYGSDATNLYFSPPLQVKVIDTTGAGDAFGIGATWAIAMGMDLPTAMICGTLNATSVVQSMGAQSGLLTDTEIQSQLRQNLVTVERLSW